ncbi:MAG: hypothetical protein KatS3mg060_2707 [Dehalococcoidia bacterium]|nr:MAG: hypothetical protein KatS3mg060_2707 [Dehalococcoidia bacterium]
MEPVTKSVAVPRESPLSEQRSPERGRQVDDIVVAVGGYLELAADDHGTAPSGPSGWVAISSGVGVNAPRFTIASLKRIAFGHHHFAPPSSHVKMVTRTLTDCTVPSNSLTLIRCPMRNGRSTSK